MTHDDPHSHSADAVQEGRPVEAQYVRGGRKGVRVLWILIGSAGLAAVVLIGLWLATNGAFENQNDNIGQDKEAVATYSGETPPAPPTN